MQLNFLTETDRNVPGQQDGQELAFCFLKGKRAGSSKRQDTQSTVYSGSLHSATKLEIEFPFPTDNIQENFRQACDFLRKSNRKEYIYQQHLSDLEDT